MNIKLGCAPINWSNDDLPSLGGELTYQQCLSEMALAGYTGSEGGWKYPKEYEVIKKALDIRGMEICNMWFSSLFTSFENEKTYEAFDKHLEYTSSLGAKVAGIGECGITIHGDQTKPILKDFPRLTDEQFENLAKGLNELGKRAKAKGMKACFHYHLGTGVQTLEDIDRLMSLVNEDVYLVFDTGHATTAGINAAELLTKYIDRVGHIHVKDVRSEVLNRVKSENLSFLEGVKSGMFTVPGDGDMVDWKTIFETIKNSNYEGYIVVEAEQDPAIADPLEYAQKARTFMREHLGI